eukprot:Blabericola_migrator_1__12843@NODE_832_length_6348_cov_238_992039_g587_i0_p5_GENE_NODE_832_length_6348_cov_238_992039_g587_i0NODE_832_length_6348_cov_238_992039_g587_i0_p5_ORF_typecomplete_len193_score18_10_NODE_832_length_6348_cov_238_992039_g587_i0263841
MVFKRIFLLLVVPGLASNLRNAAEEPDVIGQSKVVTTIKEPIIKEKVKKRRAIVETVPLAPVAPAPIVGVPMPVPVPQQNEYIMPATELVIPVTASVTAYKAPAPTPPPAPRPFILPGDPMLPPTDGRVAITLDQGKHHHVSPTTGYPQVGYPQVGYPPYSYSYPYPPFAWWQYPPYNIPNMPRPMGAEEQS